LLKTRCHSWHKLFLVYRNVLLLPAWSFRPENLDRVLRTANTKYLTKYFLLGLRVFHAGVLLPNCLCADLHWKISLVVSGLIYVGLVDKDALGDCTSQALV
jgi:hypothetical protein